MIFLQLKGLNPLYCVTLKSLKNSLSHVDFIGTHFKQRK